MPDASGEIRQYDRVQLTRVADAVRPTGNVSRRAPRAGDIATVVERYDSPDGYELECTDPSGATIWLETLTADQVDLIRVHRPDL